MQDIKPNAIYRYDKGRGWCKHGIVYTYLKDGKLYANDTYGDSEFSNINGGYCSGMVTTYEVEKIKDDLDFVMMVDEVMYVSKEDFYLYEEKDKLFMPMSSSCHERYIVKKNATKSKERVIEDLKLKIECCKNEIKWAKEKLKKYEEELRKYENN